MRVKKKNWNRTSREKQQQIGKQGTKMVWMKRAQIGKGNSRQPIAKSTIESPAIDKVLLKWKNSRITIVVDNKPIWHRKIIQPI